MSSPLILVVDDESHILRALRTSLQGAGYEVEVAATAEEALASAAMQPPNGVILDLVLPDGSGVEVCRELRRWTNAPVLVLSAVGDEQEKIAALDAGADDYVTKPFGIDELLARLRAALRRVEALTAPVIEIGELVVDLERRLVTVRGEPVSLTPTEFELLRLFVRNEGKLLTHPTILREVWDRPTEPSPTTCTSTCLSYAERSSRIRHARAFCSPKRAPAIASCGRLESILSHGRAILRRP